MEEKDLQLVLERLSQIEQSIISLRSDVMQMRKELECCSSGTTSQDFILMKNEVKRLRSEMQRQKADRALW